MTKSTFVWGVNWVVNVVVVHSRIIHKHVQAVEADGRCHSSRLSVPLQEAVGVRRASVAQPYSAFLAPLTAVISLPFVCAESTTATFTPTISIYLHGKVTERYGVKSSATASRSASTTIITNK